MSTPPTLPSPPRPPPRPARPDSSRLEGLTGLRAVAAAWVLAFHYSLGPFRPLGTAHASPFVDAGFLGVDLFFILSGFVIWHVHGPEMARPTLRKFGRFMCLRLARLYPVNLFTLLLLALLLLLRPQWGDPPLKPASWTGRQFLLQMALVQSWGFTNHLAWNYPSWSVSAEWFCYLLFPILAVLAARAGPRGVVGGIIVLFLGIAVDYRTILSGSLNHAVGTVTLLRAAPEFLLGCLLRELTRQVELTRWPFTAVVAGFAVVWVISFETVLPVGLLAIPLFATMVLAASAENSLISRMLSLRPVVATGAASYSLYLMQAPVQKAAHILRSFLSLAHPVRDAVIVAAYLGSLALGTIAVHRYVENPSRRWLRRRIDAWLPSQPRRREETSLSMTRTPAP